MSEPNTQRYTPKDLAVALDGVKTDGDVVDSINLLGVAPGGMERAEMLAFVRKVGAVEDKSIGVNVALDTDGQSLLFDIPKQFKAPEIRAISEYGSQTSAEPVLAKDPTKAELRDLTVKDWTGWLQQQRNNGREFFQGNPTKENPKGIVSSEALMRSGLARDQKELDKLTPENLHSIGEVVRALQNSNSEGALKALKAGFSGENFAPEKYSAIEKAANLALQEQKVEWKLSIGAGPDNLLANLIDMRSHKAGQPYKRYDIELRR